MKNLQVYYCLANPYAHNAYHKMEYFSPFYHPNNLPLKSKSLFAKIEKLKIYLIYKVWYGVSKNNF